MDERIERATRGGRERALGLQGGAQLGQLHAQCVVRIAEQPRERTAAQRVHRGLHERARLTASP